MVLTFPHLGNTYIVAKALLDDFGTEYVTPPFNSNKTLEIGLKYCSEAHCLPFKLFVGNMVQGHELGADTMLITGGCGPCRLGYFGEMLKKAAKDIGLKMDVITLELPDQGVSEMIARVKRISGNASLVSIGKVINAAKNVSVQVDRLEQLARQKRAVQKEKGAVDAIYHAFQKNVLDIKGSRNILNGIQQTMDELNRLETRNDTRPLKIAIVGEIYTTVEPYANFRVEEMLGKMGIEVERKVMVSDWIINDMVKKGLHLPADLEHEKASKKYLGRMVGGHTHHTIGNSVLHAKDGYDGIIHLYPLGCMPEIVSQAILPTVEEDCGIPIMTIIRDEMTGEAGFTTRIEAFVDLLKKRREEKINDKSKVLYGY